MAIDRHLVAYYIGIFIIFGSHLYMVAGNPMAQLQMKQHAYLNLVAGLLIAYYFMHTQGYIKW